MMDRPMASSVMPSRSQLFQVHRTTERSIRGVIEIAPCPCGGDLYEGGMISPMVRRRRAGPSRHSVSHTRPAPLQSSGPWRVLRPSVVRVLSDLTLAQAPRVLPTVGPCSIPPRRLLESRLEGPRRPPREFM